MSTAKDRLFEVYEAYRYALEQRQQDLKEADTKAQVRKVLDNLDKLQAKYLEVVLAELNGTGSEVEAAYITARKANADTKDAYADARSLAERIRQVGELLTAVTSLVKKAIG